MRHLARSVLGLATFGIACGSSDGRADATFDPTWGDGGDAASDGNASAGAGTSDGGSDGGGDAGDGPGTSGSSADGSTSDSGADSGVDSGATASTSGGPGTSATGSSATDGTSASGSTTTAGTGGDGEPTQDGWSVVDVNTTADLVAVDFADAQHGWVVGTDEVLMRTEDGGANWVSQNAGFFTDTNQTARGSAHVIAPGPAYGVYHLIDVHATSADVAWVASVGPLASPPSADPDHLTAVFVTDDGGATWTRVVLATNFQIWGIFGFDGQSARAASIGSSSHPDSDVYLIDGATDQTSVPMTFLGLRDIAFVDASTGFVVGSGGIFRTDDGGTNWSGVSAPGGSYWALDVVSASVAVAVGEGGLVARTTDGGNSWAAQDGGSADLYGVSFADAQNGFAVGDPGVALRTDDGGATWTSEDAGTNAFINDVAAIAASEAWAVADGGVLLHKM